MTTRTRGHGRLLLGAMLATALVAPAASAQSPPTDLFLSEYVESGNVKALEFYNGTADPIDVAGWTVEGYFNGSTSPWTTATATLSGVVQPDDTFVLANSGLNGVADQVKSGTWFNGDDGLVLRNATGTLVDSFGSLGVDPGPSWGSGPTAATSNTLRRKATVCVGDTVFDDAFDPATEYDGLGSVTTAGLGAHAVECADEPPVDTEPPTLSVMTDPSVIRSRNHKMVPVTVTLEVTDDTDDDVDVELVSVVSSDPDDGVGDGSTTGDIEEVSDTQVLVRAERSRSRSRTYTFTYRATDDAGNSTMAEATVIVG